MPASSSSTQYKMDDDTLDITVVSQEEADSLFKKYMGMNLNWNIPEYGCQARAALFAYEAENTESVKVGKAMMVTKDPMKGYFLSQTKEDHQICYKWSFHVVPVIRVLTNNGIEPFVLDPTLFDKPETLHKWKEISSSAKYNDSVKIQMYSRFRSTPIKFNNEEELTWEESDIPGARKFIDDQKNEFFKKGHLKYAFVSCKDPQ